MLVPGWTASNSSGCGSSNALAVARRFLAIEDEALALFEHRSAALEMADAKLGPLQVEQDRRRPAEFFLERADTLDQLRFLLLVAVAHVDPEGVGAGQHQLADHLRRRSRRARASPGSSPCACVEAESFGHRHVLGWTRLP